MILIVTLKEGVKIITTGSVAWDEAKGKITIGIHEIEYLQLNPDRAQPMLCMYAM